VIVAGLRLLDVLAAREGTFRLEVEHFPWDSQRYPEQGRYIPGRGLEKLKAFDAIYFGAVGHTEVPDQVSQWGCVWPSCRASTSTPTSLGTRGSTQRLPTPVEIG
jgi:tartrate dehydrogenase/decarboxylase / D-malate dehydrogenase